MIEEKTGIAPAGTGKPSISPPSSGGNPRRQGMKSGRTRFYDFIFNLFNYGVTGLFTLMCFYPFYYLFLVSISDSHAVSRGEVIFWPSQMNLTYYAQVFDLPGLYRSFFVSVARSVLGTLITLFFTTMLAYVLTKKEFRWRKPFYWITIFTMYVSAGLIPYVLSMTALGLKNSFMLYILPGAVSAFHMVLIKTYIEQLPGEVEESAIVDGAGYFTILMRIIFPCSKPVIAAVAVMTAVGQWNSFQDNFFLVNDRNLTTMQLTLWNFLQQAEILARKVTSSGTIELSNLSPPSPFTIKCAISVITMVPIMLVYPFLQRHFASGIMLGAVKG